MPTRSPRRDSETWGPAFTTVPTPSWPMMELYAPQANTARSSERLFLVRIGLAFLEG